MLALTLVPWATGCRQTSQATADGGEDGSVSDEPQSDAPAPDGAMIGVRSFDVVAAISGAADAEFVPPQTDRFTLVIDADARRAIAGGNGPAAVIGITSSDEKTFRSTGAFGVAVRGFSCAGFYVISYDSFEVTVTGDSLVGSASGKAKISLCGDCGARDIPFTATLTGLRDATPPALDVVDLGGVPNPFPTTPFDDLYVRAREPLPISATARLVGDDGSTVDLVPQIIDGEVPLVVGFTKPKVVLRTGRAYGIALGGLVDFAGLVDRSGVLVRYAGFAEAPTVAEDGFESVTDATFGGAMVMTTGGPLPAISGNTSLYVGTGISPGIDSPSWLTARLARQPGDTMLRFSYRMVAGGSSTLSLRVGSEGASPLPNNFRLEHTVPTPPTETIMLGGRQINLYPVDQGEVALPADATGDVLIVINSTPPRCPLPLGGGGPSGSVLIDDLRLE